jgi:plastocyanin
MLMLDHPLRGMLLLLVLAAAVAALWPGAAASAATRTVTVGDDLFAPKTIAIARGDSVRWVWGSGRHKHNVVSPSFGNSGVKRRGTFAVRFAHAGRYRYFCYLHEGMNGTVIVRR